MHRSRGVVIMGSTDEPHVHVDEVGTESRDAQSAWIGGGRSQPILSAARFGAANEGSRRRRRPLLWAAGWVGGAIALTAIFILIVR
jgi:hypothetical protein